MLREKTCERCGQAYPPNGPAQKLCDACWVFKTCQDCKREFQLSAEERSRHRAGRKLCDECCSAKRGEPKTRQAQQSGGTEHRRVNVHGYVDINLGYQRTSAAPDGREGWEASPSGGSVIPRLDHGGYVYLGRVKEHRWVMERRLGRQLLADEEVHHRNGHREDNDRFCKACGAELPDGLGSDGLMHCACGWQAKPNLELWLVSQPKGQRMSDLLEHCLEGMTRTDPVVLRDLLAEYGYRVAECSPAVLPEMNILTWVIAGVASGYLLFLLWLIRRHRADPVQQEADRGVRELEDYLR